MGSEAVTHGSAIKQVETAWTRFGSLINTALILLAATGVIWTRAEAETNLRRDIDANKAAIEQTQKRADERWAGHESYHRDRLADAKVREGETAERFKQLDSQFDVLPQITFRLTSVESQVQTMNTFMAETRKDISAIATSVELIKQYLETAEQRDRTATRFSSPRRQ